MQASEKRNWSEGLDTQLLQRLLHRARRPGLIDITQATTIIARLEGMAANLALAERLNQRWQPVDDETPPAPIVYVVLRPNELSLTPNSPNEPKKARSRTEKERAKDSDNSTSTPVTHPQAPGPLAPPVGSAPTSIKSQPVVAQGKEQAVVQRKAADAPATIAMPIASQVPTTDTPLAPDFTPQTLQAHGEAGKLPVESISTQSGDNLTPQQSGRVPIAPTTAHPFAPANIRDATSATPLPVVSPITRVEARLTTLATATLPTEERIDAKDKDSSEQAGNEVSSGARQQPPVVIVPVQGNKTAVPEYSPTSVLPFVRERILAEAGAARIQQRRPLPLAAAAALHSQGEIGKSQPPGVSSAAGQPRVKQRQQQSVMRAHGQRSQSTTAAPGDAVAAATSSPTPAAIDIDRIVHKVERRFIRRLAVEAERRRIKKWL